jgi:site-specific DNA-methyltransferase (adenine-specific)
MSAAESVTTEPDLSPWLGRVTCGDCLELLRELPANSVDSIITDPPYELGSYDAPTWHRENRGATAEGVQSWDVIPWGWIREAARVIGDRGCVLSFCKLHDAGAIRKRFARLGLKPRDILTWVNTTPIPRGRRPVYQSSAQAIVWSVHPGCFVDLPKDGRERWNVIEGPNTRSNTERTGHPTQKPEWLMRLLVRRHARPGGVVLDPFAGSGTTGVACAQEGRQFIGFELDPGYCSIANARIAHAQAEAGNRLPL